LCKSFIFYIKPFLQNQILFSSQTDAPKRSDNTELDNNKLDNTELDNTELDNTELDNTELDNNKRRSALSCKTTPAPALPPLLYEYYFSST